MAPKIWAVDLTIDINSALDKQAASFRAEQCMWFAVALHDILGLNISPSTYALQITDRLCIRAACGNAYCLRDVADEGDSVSSKSFFLCYGRKRGQCYTWQQVAYWLKRWKLYTPKPPVVSLEHQAAEAELNEFLKTNPTLSERKTAG